MRQLYAYASPKPLEPLNTLGATEPKSRSSGLPERKSCPARQLRRFREARIARTCPQSGSSCCQIGRGGGWILPVWQDLAPARRYGQELPVESRRGAVGQGWLRDCVAPAPRGRRRAPRRVRTPTAVTAGGRYFFNGVAGVAGLTWPAPRGATHAGGHAARRRRRCVCCPHSPRRAARRDSRRKTRPEDR